MGKVQNDFKKVIQDMKIFFKDLFRVENNEWDPRLTDVKIQLLSEDAIIPKLATQGSVGFDFHSIEDVIIEPMESKLISTGIAIELPDMTELQIRSRSGLSVKHTVFVLNSPGTIDTDYRGEIKICLFNLGKEPFAIKKGDRIAQGVLNSVVLPKFVKVDTLSMTSRADNGFGSTGV